MTRVLVIAELDAGKLASATLNTIGAAQLLEPDAIDVAVLAAETSAAADEAACVSGVSCVRLVTRPENAGYLAATWAPQLAELAAGYTHVLAPATTFGTDLLPRVAALLGIGALSSVTGIHGPRRFSRPVYAGNIIAEIDCPPGSRILATIRQAAFSAPGAQAPAPIEAAAIDAELPTHTRLIRHRAPAHAGPELQTADTVVAGGRGLAGEAGVELIRALANTLNAAVGASRAAVDSGWMGNELQLGQTGKIVAPRLYIGVGISGAIQHLTGIREAGTIVAINQDPEAPLSKLADITLIADLFEAVPALTARLNGNGGR